MYVVNIYLLAIFHYKVGVCNICCQIMYILQYIGKIYTLDGNLLISTFVFFWNVYLKTMFVQLGINVYICSCFWVVYGKQSFDAASVISAVKGDVSICSFLDCNLWYLSFYLNGSYIIYLIFLYDVSTNIQVANHFPKTLFRNVFEIQVRCLDTQFQIVVLVCTIYIHRTDS